DSAPNEALDQFDHSGDGTNRRIATNLFFNVIVRLIELDRTRQSMFLGHGSPEHPSAHRGPGPEIGLVERHAVPLCALPEHIARNAVAVDNHPVHIEDYSLHLVLFPLYDCHCCSWNGGSVLRMCVAQNGIAHCGSDWGR